MLPIGGLKEKVLAAHRAGIDTIIIPIDNKKDIDEIPQVVKKKIKFVFASDMDIVLRTALVKSKSRSVVKDCEVNEIDLVQKDNEKANESSVSTVALKQ